MVALGTVYPLGAVLQGALGDRVGLRAVTAAGAALYLLVLVTAGLARPDLAVALDDLPGAPEHATDPQLLL
jgi:hypothetical protein